jgi:hypothetical protein
MYARLIIAHKKEEEGEENKIPKLPEGVSPEDIVKEANIDHTMLKALLYSGYISSLIYEGLNIGDTYRGAEQLVQLLYPLIFNSETKQLNQYESAFLAILDKEKKILKIEKVSTGSRNTCLIDNGEIIASVIANGGSGFVIAHNHPGGEEVYADAFPDQDTHAYSILCIAAQLAGITMHDGIIFGKSTVVSLIEHRPDFFNNVQKLINQIKSGLIELGKM